MIYVALFSALSSLLTVGYITLYNGGIKVLQQVSLIVRNINVWPLVLLTVAGVLVGLVIRRFGQNGGLGVAQRQYAQTGRINPRKVPSIILQAFITVWSGSPVGPEGPLVFSDWRFRKLSFRTTQTKERRCSGTRLQFNSRGIRWFPWFTCDWSSL